MEESTVSTRLQERKHLFQKSLDISEIKNRRESFAIELRKHKRIQDTTKRRFLVTGHEAFNEISRDILDKLKMNNLDPLIIKIKPELAHPEYSVFQKLIMLREILLQDTHLEVISKIIDYIWETSTSHPSFINTLVDLGFIPAVVKYLDPSFPEDILVRNIQEKACSIIANIGSGNHELTSKLMYYIPLRTFFKLLYVQNIKIRFHILWALSNISGDCDDYRKKISTTELMERVYELINNTDDLEMLKTISWCMTNFTSNCKHSSQEFREKALEILKELMQIKDQKLDQNCLWALCSLTTGDDDDLLIFEEMLNSESGMLELIRKNIFSDDPDTIAACIRLCANITASNDKHIQIIIDKDIVQNMTLLIRSNEVSIRKEILLMISNISASSVSFHIDYLINQPIFKEALTLINDNTVKVSNEALWIYNNLSTSCSDEQLLQIISLGVLDNIKEALVAKDPNIIMPLLNFIDALLRAGKYESEQAGDTSNQVAVLLDESGCLNALENCQNVSKEVYSMIGEIIEAYYGFEEETNAVPIEIPDGGFDFS